MFKIKRDSLPAAFRKDFREISRQYPTGFSQSSFEKGGLVVQSSGIDF